MASRASRMIALVAVVASATACTSSGGGTASPSPPAPAPSTSSSPFGTRVDPSTLAAKLSAGLARRAIVGVDVIVYDVSGGRHDGDVISDVKGTVRLQRNRITDFDIRGIGGDDVIEARRVRGATWYRTGVAPGTVSPWHPLAPGTGHAQARRIVTQIEGAMTIDRAARFLPAASEAVRTDYGVGGFTRYRARVPASAVPTDLPDRARLIPARAAALTLELTFVAAGNEEDLTYRHGQADATFVSVKGKGEPGKLVAPDPDDIT